MVEGERRREGDDGDESGSDDGSDDEAAELAR